MTTSTSELPTECFVWVWLPGAAEPVVAGRLSQVGVTYRFAYGRSYLGRADAISLYAPELPLRQGWVDPRDGMEMAGCLWDASPDSWGQRVIIARLTGDLDNRLDRTSFGRLTFLVESGSNRIGGLDFQTSATQYVPRSESATLDELHEAADALMAGELTPALAAALVDGTAVGGARPKVLISDGGREYIAKLSTSDDRVSEVKAEAVCMELARLAGLEVPDTHLTRSLGREVLLVERFDRPGAGQRRLMVSALTMQGYGDFLGARYSSYPDMLDVLLKHAATSGALPSRLFRRIVFNVAIGNIDDHARNHSAFWDGQHLELTPAYDLCPQPRTAREVNQAMMIGRDGSRSSQFSTCVAAAGDYGLTVNEATSVVAEVVDTIRTHWVDVCDTHELSQVDRTALLGVRVLNPYAFD